MYKEEDKGKTNKNEVECNENSIGKLLLYVYVKQKIADDYYFLK